MITGPIFDEDIETLDSGVEIPDAFFKIVIDEVDGSRGQFRLWYRRIQVPIPPWWSTSSVSTWWSF